MLKGSLNTHERQYTQDSTLVSICLKLFFYPNFTHTTQHVQSLAPEITANFTSTLET